MSLGFIILVHENFHRVQHLVEYLTAEECPVCIHVDANVKSSTISEFKANFFANKFVVFAPSFRCEWGRFSLTQASLAASEKILEEFPDINHVLLISGSCLPVQSISKLKDFLLKHKASDFIESTCILTDKWIKDGLNEERFSLFFPFAWIRHRKIFDYFVELQRFLKVKRKIPEHIKIHTGSQWWCLTRKTLSLILIDKNRSKSKSFFRHSWIPDESYFQSLARNHSDNIVSQSLTFSKFDTYGKPFILYNDHLNLRYESNVFFIRKVWIGADDLYKKFLNPKLTYISASKEKEFFAEEYFEQLIKQRTSGGGGRFNAGCFSRHSLTSENQNYTVFIGITDLFPQFVNWLSRHTKVNSHGHIFNHSNIEYNVKTKLDLKNLGKNIKIRNRNLKGFFVNFLWNLRKYHNVIHFSLNDNQKIRWSFINDKNARILIIREGWLLQLMNASVKNEHLEDFINHLRWVESEIIRELMSKGGNAKFIILELQDVLDDPGIVLKAAFELMSPEENKALPKMPKMVSLSKSKINKALRRVKRIGILPNTKGFK